MTRARTEINLLGPQKAMYGNAAPYNLCIGAQGSGKSHDIGIRSGLFLIYCPKVIGIIAANTYDQLSRATLFTTFEAWKKYFGWTEYDAKRNPGGFYVFGKEPPPHFEPHGYVFTSNNNNIYTANGGVIFTASLENYTNIEGVQVGWALLDETADTRQEAVTSVITGRLRQKGLSKCVGGWGSAFPFCPTNEVVASVKQPGPDFKEVQPGKWSRPHPFAAGGINPLFIYSKPAKVPWLKDLFRLEEHREKIISSIYSETNYFYNFDGIRQVVVYSVLHNRRNLPANFIENRLDLLDGSGLIDSHVYGNPFAKTGGEFVSEFSRIKHEVECEYEDEYPVHFSVDFNAKPHMTGIVAQLVKPPEGSKAWAELRIFDEYAMKWPQNTAGHLAEQFSSDYDDRTGYGLYVYGDASGNNAIPVKGVRSYFEDLTNNLKVNYELRVPNQNPRYKAALGAGSMGRKSFINKLFKGSFGVDVKISPRCTHLLGDLEFCVEDANGALAKKKNKDGVEEHGHHLDALQYLVCHIKFLGYLAKEKMEDEE